jgi:hypothetical protein
MAKRSLETPSPCKKGKMQSIHPSPVQTKQLSNARPQSELHLMLVCIKALLNLSN